MFEPLFGVLRQAVTPDQPVEVSRSRPRDFDPGQPSEVVERYRATSPCVIESLPGAFQSPGQAVQQSSYLAWIRISFVERLGQERSRKRAFIDVSALSQFGQLRRVGWVQSHVQPPARSGHIAMVHEPARYV